MNHGFRIRDSEYDVGLSRARSGYRLHVGDREVAVDLVAGERGGWTAHCRDSVDHLVIAVDGDDIYIHLDGSTYHLRYQHPLQRLAEQHKAAGGDTINATMPGRLVALEVAEGDHVTTGQTLVVIESMKMETSFAAPRDAVVQSVHVGTGDSFDKGAALVTLEPEA